MHDLHDVVEAGSPGSRPPPRFGRVRLPSPLVVALACSFVLPGSWGGQGRGSGLAAQQDEGRQHFETLCVVCHTVGGGTLIGPDLQGVAARRSEDWIIRFVQHSQQMVAAGDSVAVALFEQYNNIPMPDAALTDAQIRSVIAFTSEGESLAAAPAPDATPEQIVHGQELFQGTARFSNGGPTCNSCHDVAHDAVIGGGVLAIELTTVFSRLGGPGVRAILGSPPFPVMQRAYMDRPLTEDEVISLVGFLREADQDQALYQPRDYGIALFGSGIVGACLLLGLCSLIWRGRRRGSVNQEIFDRQVRSS